MIESMQAARGVGLAAPQIGVSLRVVVFGIPEEEPFAIVNPVIVKRSGERRLESEGCLSVPGYRAEITRSERVTVKGLNLDGREFRIKAEEVHFNQMKKILIILKFLIGGKNLEIMTFLKIL